MQVLLSVGVRFAEGHSVGQRFEIGSVEVHLELIACLRVEAWFDMDSGDVRVDVHDEHGAGVTLEDVQVVEIKLAVLTCERGIEVMRHSNTSFRQYGVTGLLHEGRYLVSCELDRLPSKAAEALLLLTTVFSVAHPRAMRATLPIELQHPT